MTRAKDELDILVPQRCYVLQQRRGGDRHLFAQRTRFIPEAILPYFHASLWPPAAADAPRTRQAGPRIDIGQRLRRRWG
jgi:DNA helicase-2/ATP-dependent DNA helicase PcrA